MNQWQKIANSCLYIKIIFSMSWHSSFRKVQGDLMRHQQAQANASGQQYNPPLRESGALPGSAAWNQNANRFLSSRKYSSNLSSKRRSVSDQVSWYPDHNGSYKKLYQKHKNYQCFSTTLVQGHFTVELEGVQPLKSRISNRWKMPRLSHFTWHSSLRA